MIEVTVNGSSLMDAIFDAVGDDFDGIAELEAAVRGWGPLELDAECSQDEFAAAASDDWVKAEYKERFGDGDYLENRNLRAATAALAIGDHMTARVLFDRAGRPDLGSAAVAR